MMNQGIDQGVAQRVDAYRGNPQALQQKYAVSQELVDLLALQKIKSEKEAAARQMQMQMAQQQAANGEPPTIAEQREKEVMEMTKQEMVQQQAGIMQQKQEQQQEGMQKLAQGIASAPGAQMAAQPQMMAAGGIVAFAGGTGVEDPRRKRREGESFAEYRARMFALDLQLSKERKAKENAEREAERQRRLKERGEGNMVPPSPFFDREPLPAPDGSPAPQPSTQAEAQAEAPRQDPLRAQEAQANIPDGSKPEPVAPAPVPAPPPDKAPARIGLPPSSLPAQQAGAGVELPPLPQEDQFSKDIKTGIQELMGKDPSAMAKASREEGLAFLTTPGRAEAVTAQQKALADLDAQQLDPERLRQQGLESFLLGAGGQGSIGRALGAGGRSAVNFERNRADEQRRRLLERNKMLRDEFDIDARDRKGAFEAGEKRFGEGSSDVRQGIASGTSMRNTDLTTAASIRNTDVNAKVAIRNADQQMQTAGLDRDVRVRISVMQSQVQQETAAALRESTSQTRVDQQITRNQQLRLNAAKDAAASFDRQIAQLVTLQALQKLDARQQALLNQLQDDKARAVRAAVGPIDAEIDRLSGVNSNSGSKLSPKEDAALNKYPSKGQ